MVEKVLRLFVSSPGDVAGERRRVELVVDRLNVEFDGQVRIETIRWETSFYSAHDTFQKQIPEAAECDVVVAVFRARLGTELPARFARLPSGEQYPSGTAYEILSAIERRKAGQGLPDIYVFRYPHAPLVALDAPDRAEIETQWARLTTFFDTWFRTKGGEFLAAFQEYSSTDEFARKIEECLRQWLQRRGFVAHDRVWDRTLRGSPFPGLSAFEADRRNVYFGRDLAIRQAVARLRRASEGGTPFLLVVGASGSGKSSLLRAGLLPRLTMPGAIPDVDLWRQAIVAPGPEPFLSLAEGLFADNALGPELRAGTFRTKEILARQLAGDPRTAVLPVRDGLERAADAQGRQTNSETPRPVRLALAIDQAERLFTEADPGAAAAFCRLVAELTRDNLATVVMVLRSDAYARLQTVEAIVGLRETGATLDFLPPSAAELEDIVSGPVAACQPPLVFEANGGRRLASVLVSDAKGGDALPLLQMTLARLYEAEVERGDGVLRFRDYRGMDAAVTATADEALATVSADARAELPSLVTALVREVGTDPATGAPNPVVAALDRGVFEKDKPARKALVDAFVAKRLLTTEGDGARERLRPVHEALLRIWPKAQAIVAETASLIQVRNTLEPMVRQWLEASEADRTSHIEISPALLHGAQRLVAHFGDDLPEAMRGFIAQAVEVDAARRDRERQVQERRIRDAEALAAANRRIARRTLVGLAVALLAVVLTTVLTVVAVRQWREAETQRAAAETGRREAQSSLWIAQSRADLGSRRVTSAVGLAYRAFALVPSAASRSALLTALLEVSPHLLAERSLGGRTGLTMTWADAETVAVGLGSRTVAYLPFTAKEAAGRSNGLREEPFSLGEASVAALSRGREGGLLAVMKDGSVDALAPGAPALQLYKPALRMTADPGASSAVSIGNSGKVVAIASVDSGVVLLLCDQPLARNAHPRCSERSIEVARARAVALSPDETRVAIGGADSSVTIRKADAEPAALSIHVGAEVLSLNWSSGGEWLAAGTSAGGIVIIDPKRGKVVARTDIGNDPIAAIAWSSATTDLAFGCEKVRLCVWRLRPGDGDFGAESISRFAGHESLVRSVAWAPDGQRLASLDTGGSVRIWSLAENADVRSGLRARPGADLTTLAVSADGSDIVAGTSAGELFAWRSGAPVRALRGTSDAEITSLALSRNGGLAAARNNGTLSIWTKGFPEPPVSIAVTDGSISRIAWNPAASVIAAVLPDSRRVALVDPAAPDAARATLLPGSNEANELPEGLAWYPNGDALVVSHIGWIDIWDPTSRRRRSRFPTAATQRVGAGSLSVSPDARWLATSGGDPYAVVYDLSHPATSRRLPTGPTEPSIVAFSPRGGRIAVLASDGSAYVWTFASPDAIPTPLLTFRVLPFAIEQRNESGTVAALAWTDEDRLAFATSLGEVEAVDLNIDHWRSRIETIGAWPEKPPN